MLKSLRYIAPALLAVATFGAAYTYAHCGSCETKDACTACPEEMMHVKPNTLHLGLKGYSPVSYFSDKGPHVGSPLHSATHKNVTYFFANDEEKQIFMATPDKYLPAYGGWCAYGMAVEGRFDADPTHYKIVDGRIMLFLLNDEMDTLKAWNDANEKELTVKADAYYEKLRG